MRKGKPIDQYVLKEPATVAAGVPGNLPHDSAVPGKAGAAFKESAARYHSFFELSKDCLIIAGTGGRILEANPAACTAFQMTAAELCSIELAGIADVKDPRFIPFLAECLRAGKATAEITFKRKDTTIFTGEITAARYKDEDGEERISIIIREGTADRKAEERFAESDGLYSDLFLLSPQPMWVFETETFKFIEVNKAAMDLYGYSREEFMNMTLLDIKPKEDINQAKANIKRRTAGYGVSRDTFKHFKKSGEVIEVEVYSNPIVLDDKVYLLVIASDVTERNRHEHRIIKAIIHAQEEERYEIGEQLHENVCQILASGQLSLGMLRDSQNAAGALLVSQCKEHITQASREIRKLSHRLAPAFHDFTTLKQEFILLLKSFDPEDKYKIGLQVDDAVKQYNIPLDIKLNLYRILQEQLKNTFEHANCTTIDVKLSVQDNKIRMIISDDGVGFEVSAARDGIGLSNMKRRATLFSGKLEVNSSPGKGCTVVIDIPLTQLAEQLHR